MVAITAVDLLTLATNPLYFQSLLPLNVKPPQISLFAFAPAFNDLFYPNVSAQLVANFPWQAFHEVGVYNQHTNSLYVSSNYQNLQDNINITVLALNSTYDIQNITSTQFPNLYEANGGTTYWPPGADPNSAPPQQLWCDEGDFTHPSALVAVDPAANSSRVIINNYLGSKTFSSINDVRQHPHTGDIWFTDADYGYFQYFRPAPAVPKQVYRFEPTTGRIRVVADGFVQCNGLEFSPDLHTLYVTDTGAQLFNVTPTNPATIYAYDVSADNKTLSGRRTFAYIDKGLPDGIHTDEAGNVWSGCGDGVQVWDREGVLLGKVYIGETSNNFAFAPNGRMWVFSNYRLWQLDGLKSWGREVRRDFGL